MTKKLRALLALPAMALVWAGCHTVAVSGEVYVPVYGDYGYMGPWDHHTMIVEGGYYSAPPFDRNWPRDHRNDDSRREEPGRQHVPRAPEIHPPSPPPAHPIPSIPNRPRPVVPHVDRIVRPH